MTSPVISIGIILWGLFMIGGATWAVYAGRRDRSTDAGTALAEAAPGTPGDSGATEAGARTAESPATEAADGEGEDMGHPDAFLDAEEGGGAQLGGYVVAGLILLLGLVVTAMGVWTLL